jgi:sec-independent protein translocase protein TatA
MAGLGWQELVIVLVIIMIIFGAGKLPEVARSLGQGVKEFKKEANSPETLASTASDTTAERRDEGKVIEPREMRAEEI